MGAPDKEPEDDDYKRGVRFGCLLGVGACLLTVIFAAWLRHAVHVFGG